MIGSILLGVWLGPPIVIGIIGLVVLMIKRRRFLPLDDPEDFPIAVVGLFAWPVLVIVGCLEYRDERKRKLEEVSEAIEIHYKDKWYE